MPNDRIAPSEQMPRRELLPPRELTAVTTMHRPTAVGMIAVPLGVVFVAQLLILLFPSPWRMVGHLIMWYALPAAAFAYAYRRLTKLRRRWEGMPQTSIGAMQPGPVRLRGRLERLHNLIVPGARIKAAYLTKCRKIAQDEGLDIERSDSADNRFYLVDDTGRALIDPRGAQIVTTKTFIRRLKRTEYDSSLWDTSVHDDFNYLPEGETVTVIGFARELEAKDSPRTRRVIERLREIKSDPELLAKYDLDGDGVIDEAEWEAVRREATEEIARRPQGRIERLMIGKPPLESAPYYIGKDSPVESFRWKFMIALGVYAGLTLLVIVPMYFGSMWFRDLLMLLLED